MNNKVTAFTESEKSIYTVLDSGTMDVDESISDHKATYIAIQISIKISTSYYREVWNTGKMEVDEFISDHKATYISIQISIKISTSY